MDIHHHLPHGDSQSARLSSLKTDLCTFRVNCRVDDGRCNSIPLQLLKIPGSLQRGSLRRKLLFKREYKFPKPGQEWESSATDIRILRKMRMDIDKTGRDERSFPILPLDIPASRSIAPGARKRNETVFIPDKRSIRNRNQ